jgi:transposase
MFSLSNAHRYFLYNGDCDMRKSFNGLCGLVSAELGRDPTSGEVFIFVNRRRTHIKLLHWQPGGLVLYYKRLEAGTLLAQFKRMYADLALQNQVLKDVIEKKL